MSRAPATRACSGWVGGRATGSGCLANGAGCGQAWLPCPRLCAWFSVGGCFRCWLHCLCCLVRKLCAQSASIPYPRPALRVWSFLVGVGPRAVAFSTRLAETTIDNNNVTLWQYVTPSSVLEWARSMVASRLATTGEEWTSTFSRYNSGYVVYNAQDYYEAEDPVDAPPRAVVMTVLFPPHEVTSIFT